MFDPRWALRWSLRQFQASPSAWCLCAASLGLVPLLDAARGVGLAAQDTELTALAAESVWLCTLGGALLGLSAAHSGRFLLERAGSAGGMLAAFLLIAVSAATAGGAAALGATWVDPEAGLAAAARAFPAALHLGALAVLVLRLPGSPLLQQMFLATGVLVLPAVLQGRAPVVDVLQGLLDPAAAGGLVSTLAAGGALILAALLVPAPRSAVA